MKRIEKVEKTLSLWRQTTTHEEVIKNIKKMNHLFMLLLWVRCFRRVEATTAAASATMLRMCEFACVLVYARLYHMKRMCNTHKLLALQEQQQQSSQKDPTKLETKWVETIRLRSGITVFLSSCASFVHAWLSEPYKPKRIWRRRKRRERAR